MYYYWQGYKKDDFDKSIVILLKEVIEDFTPDIIHIFGTESNLGHIIGETDVPCVVHIQGILSTVLNVYKLEEESRVVRKDTQGKASFKTIRKNLWKFIYSEIESYSHFDVTITDRYHGTIFSLCAGTPVVIIKTTDHKVITGADWFKDIYDDYVYVAKDLEDAIRISQKILKSNLAHTLRPYFKTEYYDKLKSLFEQR